jgi:hypothetical protein
MIDHIALPRLTPGFCGSLAIAIRIAAGEAPGTAATGVGCASVAAGFWATTSFGAAAEGAGAAGDAGAGDVEVGDGGPGEVEAGAGVAGVGAADTGATGTVTVGMGVSPAARVASAWSPAVTRSAILFGLSGAAMTGGWPVVLTAKSGVGSRQK